jgi:DNA-binding CsgD family transcriptional regulator
MSPAAAAAHYSLRWNLKVAYQNHAAREFCVLWESGRDLARILKANAPIPGPILNGCRGLKQQWEKRSRLNRPHPELEQQEIHHPKRPYLRATLSLKQLGSAGVVQPHFLIACEELRQHGEARPRGHIARLPQLIRLTHREQEIARLTCEGRSNQEIADDTVLSLAMVKKHLHAIFRRLEVSSRSRLIALMR